MAADIFRAGIDHDCGAMVERTDQERGRSVVDDQRDSELTANRGNFSNRKGLKLRIGQAFGVVSTGTIIGGAAEGFGIGRVDKAHLDAEVDIAAHAIQRRLGAPARMVGANRGRREPLRAGPAGSAVGHRANPARYPAGSKALDRSTDDEPTVDGAGDAAY